MFLVDYREGLVGELWGTLPGRAEAGRIGGPVKVCDIRNFDLRYAFTAISLKCANYPDWRRGGSDAQSRLMFTQRLGYTRVENRSRTRL